ncbi:MAG: hypothetical protein KGH89_03260 [Thaumarchaeota archaeon]|nr:hypothetical protein [Nitrososphaerota archaeon]
MNKQVHKIGEMKSYIPNDTLVNFVQEWLQLHREKENLTKAGKELSTDEKKKIRELDRMKVYVLDTVIFPAMADLTYFFESIAVSEKLAETFEDEVAELLDPRKAAEAAKFSGNNMRFNSTQFRKNNLARLVMSMVSIPNGKIRGGKPTTDFRVGIMYQMLNVVGDMMDHLISSQYSFGNQIWKSAYEDYSRLMGWLSLLAGLTEEQPKEYDRQIGFEPIWHSNKANLAGFHL